MSIAILSANFGAYNERSELPAQAGISDAVMVTDSACEIRGWRNVVASPDADPRLASKIVKCQPELFVESDVVIWVDAQVKVLSEAFAMFCMTALQDGEIAVLRHPRRVSLREEAKAGRSAEGRGRFAGQDTKGQVEHYLAQGHPDDWGLYWTMILVRRMTPRVRALGARWLAEQRRWSQHDQLSFPFVCRTMIGEPAEIPYPDDLIELRPRW